MSRNQLIVARLFDGTTVKGFTTNFFPNHPSFHIRIETGDQVAVRMSDLKAVFFVRSLEGNPDHHKSREFPDDADSDGRGEKVAVLFKDGEVLTGYAQTFRPGSQGFYLAPSDNDGNNVRVYVLNRATNCILFGYRAEELANSAPQRPWPMRI
jgi:hypothetical protein